MKGHSRTSGTIRKDQTFVPLESQRQKRKRVELYTMNNLKTNGVFIFKTFKLHINIELFTVPVLGSLLTHNPSQGIFSCLLAQPILTGQGWSPGLGQLIHRLPMPMTKLSRRKRYVTAEPISYSLHGCYKLQLLKV